MGASSGNDASATAPWLGIVFAIACIGVSLFAYLESQRVAGTVEAALAEPRAYFLEHPYLEPGPVLARSFGPVTVENLRRAHEAERLRRGSVPTPPGIARRQQAELERRVARALEEADRLPARRLGTVPAAEPSPAWLSYTLLHTGNAHLIGNLLLVLFLGAFLEYALGRARLVVLALAATAAGAASFRAAFPAAEGTALVGSSCLAAGLLVAFVVRLWSERREAFYGAGIALGALWLALPPWLGARWSLAEVQLAADAAGLPATAVFPALAGAAVCGAGLALLAALTGLDGRVPIAASGALAHPLYARARRAREKGRPREALESLRALLREQPDAYEAALALWDVARELGQHDETEAALLRLVRIELRRGLVEAAIDHWLELATTSPPDDAEPALLIRMALLLREHGQPRPALAALRGALERAGDGAAHVVASRVAKAARDLDPQTAEDAAWRALRSLELSLEERQALEALLAEVLPSPSERVTQLHAAAPERPAPAPSEPERSGAIELQTSERALDVVVTVPLELDDEGLRIATPDGARKLVRYGRIEAVAVAAVQGLGPKPVLVIDLVLNWMTPANETLRVIRFRGDRFDPRRFVPQSPSAVEALRAFVKTLLERSRATPLPDLDTVLGRPFASFDDITVYQRAVLMVEEADAPKD